MSREYLPVLWAFLIACTVTPAVGDAFMYMGLLPKDYMDVVPAFGVIVGICGVALTLTSFFVAIMFLLGDDMEDETYIFLFGKYSKYEFYWTFSLVPAAIFGYFLEVYVYAIPVTIIFIVTERLRTVQNRRVHAIMMYKLEMEARQEMQRKPEVYLE